MGNVFIIDRLRNEYRLRGPSGLARFLSTRVARRRADLLFGMDLVGSARSTDALPAVTIDRANVGSEGIADVERQIFVGDNLSYREGLKNGDLLFAGLDENGRVITYAFVLFRTHYKRVLGIGDEIPLIANCFTEPAMRGRHLYPRMLMRVCQELARQGYGRAAISCEPQNLPSIRGIERAGFVGISHIRSAIVLWRIVLVRRVQSYASWRSVS
jgi:hypothetical protein